MIDFFLSELGVTQKAFSSLVFCLGGFDTSPCKYTAKWEEQFRKFFFRFTSL